MCPRESISLAVDDDDGVQCKQKIKAYESYGNEIRCISRLPCFMVSEPEERLVIEEAEIIRWCLLVRVSRHAVCAECTVSILVLVRKKRFALL